jgi:hypothetical protein
MAWQSTIPLIVRTLINDWGDPQQYNDQRLTQIILVAAKYVQLDVSLDTTYTVNFNQFTISPDPVDMNDEIFTGLLALKAACLVDHSTIRTKSMTEGVRASLGPASLSVNGGLDGIKTILQIGPCAAYADLTEHWNIGGASYIRAVLSPFVGNNFNADVMRNNYGFIREVF